MISRIWNVVLTLLLIVAAALAIAFAGVRLVGLTPFAVLSGSMEPQYPVGSLIYVKDADPATVQVGQAITFEDGADRLVTHQVYDIDSEQRLFYTQGIANVNSAGEISHDAAPASWDALVGVPVACIPYLGYVNDWITHAPGIYVMVALVAVIMAVSIAMELHRMSVEKRRAVELERYRQDMQRRSGACAGYAQGRNPAISYAAHAVPSRGANPGAQGAPYGAASQNAYGAQPYGVANPAGVTTAYDPACVFAPDAMPGAAPYGVPGVAAPPAQRAGSYDGRGMAAQPFPYDQCFDRRSADAYAPVVPVVGKHAAHARPESDARRPGRRR